MPYNDFLDFYYTGWIETLDWVLQQDIDVIDIGHYSPGTKADIAAERTYMMDLHKQSSIWSGRDSLGISSIGT